VAQWHDVVKCPACGVKLGVPSDFTAGPCPACKAKVVQTPPRQGKRRRRRKNPDDGAVEQAADKYEAFHGSKPRRLTRVRAELPKEWWLLGGTNRDTHIQYAPPSNSRLKNSIMDHRWGDKGTSMQTPAAKVYVDPSGRYLLIMSRGKNAFKVDDRGIVG